MDAQVCTEAEKVASPPPSLEGVLRGNRHGNIKAVHPGYRLTYAGRNGVADLGGSRASPVQHG